MDKNDTFKIDQVQNEMERKARNKIIGTFLILCFAVVTALGFSVAYGVRNREISRSLETANATVAKLESEKAAIEAKNETLGVENAKLLKAFRSVILAPAPAASASSPTAESVPAYGKVPDQRYLNHDGGDWTVIAHTLAEDSQIAIEEKETSPVFEKCSGELGMTLMHCVSVIKDQKMGNGYNILKASLVKTRDGMSVRQALKVAECFNRNMKPAKKKDGTVIPNAADAVKLSGYEPECLPAK